MACFWFINFLSLQLIYNILFRHFFLLFFFALWTKILFHVTHYGPVQGPAEFSGETCVAINRIRLWLCARSSGCHQELALRDLQ